jgi:hypothetical protein
MSAPKAKPSSGARPWLSPRATLFLVLGLVLYVLLRPTLSNWLGVPLPALFPEEAMQAPAEPPTGDISDSRTTQRERGPPAGFEPRRGDRAAPSESRPSEQTTSPRADVPIAPQSEKEAESDATPSTTRPAPAPTPRKPSSTPLRPLPRPEGQAASPKAAESSAPKLGVLTDVGRGRLRSTAGLVYEQLSSEHRIDHVLRHAEDDPSRPVHGVFDGDRDVILAVIDEAWLAAQKGRPPKVVTEDNGDRTAYTVDLGRKIGFMGGQAGKRRGFPACRHLQLVVEGDEVVTAYPVIPR